MLLPCKPDRAQRDVTMGGQTLALVMQGCNAGGATFAVSHVLVPDTAQAASMLALWKTAVLAHVQATDVREQPFAVPGGWNAPQSLRLQASGRGADGAPVAMQAAWFARVDADGVHLFHAAAFSPTAMAMADAADTFFSSLAVP
ncbi:hypothetical protein [Pseudorhodoferax sp. Leaf267]|uniref:hypothetical protein n=1 Tax=Pseudorhodoferax sp. Leaf267 TaxID=1736316 RepID=UPI001F3A5349|nr:hypothetical protein [Pseudorhodoferax sp. Leaf267]